MIPDVPPQKDFLYERRLLDGLKNFPEDLNGWSDQSTTVEQLVEGLMDETEARETGQPTMIQRHELSLLERLYSYVARVEADPLLVHALYQLFDWVVQREDLKWMLPFHPDNNVLPRNDNPALADVWRLYEEFADLSISIGGYELYCVVIDAQYHDADLKRFESGWYKIHSVAQANDLYTLSPLLAHMSMHIRTKIDTIRPDYKKRLN